MKRVIFLEDVHKYYGNMKALENISLTIEEGDLVVFLGPNGSGKTTLLKIMATLIPPDKGKIELFGNYEKKKRTQLLKHMGVLFDHDAHWEELTGYENAWFFARSRGLTSSEARLKLNSYFEAFKLNEKKK